MYFFAFECSVYFVKKTNNNKKPLFCYCLLYVKCFTSTDFFGVRLIVVNVSKFIFRFAFITI